MSERTFPFAGAKLIERLRGPPSVAVPPTPTKSVKPGIVAMESVRSATGALCV
jgi:hypothetical protein